MRALRHAAVLAVALLCVAPAQAQTDASAPDQAAAVAPVSAEPAAIAPTTLRIPAGTSVEVELTEALSSETSQQQQTFGLRLAAPIVIGGREVVPAGVVGGGEVIDAAPSSFGGRQGRLIVSGRFIEINGAPARIRGMQLTANGEDRSDTALAVGMIPYAGIASIFIQGGEIEIPAGARGTARLAADIDIPISAPEPAPAAETAPQ